jgi:hypothetical protein
VEYLLSALVFLSGNLLSLAVLAATFYVGGRRLTVAFEYPDVWQEIAFSATLGFGVTASLVFVLGLANQLTRPVVLLTIAALHLISHGVWHDTIRRARSAVASSDWRKSVPHFIFVLVLIAPMLLLALYPPTQFDATLYHLPYAVAFADSGGLPFLETLRFPVFPQLQETLFVLGFFLTGEVAAQLCEFVALMLSGIVMVAWGRSLVNHRVGIWSAALWLGNPLAVWLGGAAYVDIGLTLFVTASLFAWHRWLRGAHNRWLVLSAALIGFACASKYLGLFFFAVLAIATLFVSVRRRDVRPALVVPSVVMAIAGPWYARIVYYTGNPVFPFYPNLFGSCQLDNAGGVPAGVHPAEDPRDHRPPRLPDPRALQRGIRPRGLSPAGADFALVSDPDSGFDFFRAPLASGSVDHSALPRLWVVLADDGPRYPVSFAGVAGCEPRPRARS